MPESPFGYWVEFWPLHFCADSCEHAWENNKRLLKYLGPCYPCGRPSFSLPQSWSLWVLKSGSASKSRSRSLFLSHLSVFVYVFTCNSELQTNKLIYLKKKIRQFQLQCTPSPSSPYVPPRGDGASCPVLAFLLSYFTLKLHCLVLTCTFFLMFWFRVSAILIHASLTYPFSLKNKDSFTQCHPSSSFSFLSLFHIVLSQMGFPSLQQKPLGSFRYRMTFRAVQNWGKVAFKQLHEPTIGNCIPERMYNIGQLNLSGQRQLLVKQTKIGAFCTWKAKH